MELKLAEGVHMAFVHIRPGRFRMGTPPGTPVTIARAFYFGAYPVTKRQFRAFVDAIGYETTAQKEGSSFGIEDGQWQPIGGAWWDSPGFEQTEDHPVICVSPTDALAFCSWLSRESGRSVRLPRDAEWEYACRAGTQTAYFWGDDPLGGAGFTNAEDGDWEYEGRPMPWSDGWQFTSPVGTFRPNPWGVYDTLGQVWECTSDPLSWRGGTWDYPPWMNTCDRRQTAEPGGNSWDTGFRVVAEERVLAGAERQGGEEGGRAPMEPRLVDVDELTIVGIAEKGADIGALWRRFEAGADQIGNRVEGVGYELHWYPAAEHGWEDVTVMVGVQVTETGEVPDGMVVRTLPASRYAVFTHRPAEGGYEGANAAMDAWLESGPYKLREQLSIQRYDSRFKGGEDPESEIDFLLPVVPKE